MCVEKNGYLPIEFLSWFDLRQWVKTEYVLLDVDLTPHTIIELRNKDGVLEALFTYSYICEMWEVEINQYN